MDYVLCPRCALPAVHETDPKPRHGPSSTMLLAAGGLVTLGLTWAVLGYWWLRGDYKAKPVFECFTCGHEWPAT